ncbi:MAG: plastocyanin/azurin family copper-binding protein [Thermoleophilia bacterium]|nr:plastocyanin/azurin family copper-binding protein [Thermoleophilia bacterium]MDH4339135.1 plastocyanin/azurin family copper-binding protein [Thermoleophilia bacterium]MDH5280996.1 plastocyanin/azurin family copper-binding protein [Thermoleophilia bacterium]
MTRILTVAAALVAAALLPAAVGQAALGENAKLHARVGPGFTINLTDASGARVTKLDPGTYDIEVEDEADVHNFHLRGPGVDRSTSVAGEGKELWTVEFTDGTYTYVCDPHASQMKGSFVVGNPPKQPPSSGSGGGGVVTSKTKLVLTSGPGFVITLKAGGGKTVKKMKRGTYTIVVRDRSPIHNAHVVAPGFNRKTTLRFVGSQTWKVKLARTGTLRFLCDPHAAAGMKGSAKVVR